MPPLKALDWFRSLFPGIGVRAGPWAEQQQQEAFRLAVTTEAGLLQRIHGIIRDVLESGKKVSAAPRTIARVLDEAGLTPRNPDYASMVFRTNMMAAYNRGAAEELKEASDDFPVWKYLGIRDGRQGADHEPHFDRYYPSRVSFEAVRGDRPFNCRCTFQPIYRDDWKELQAKGARLAEGYAHTSFADDGLYHGPEPPGPGWVQVEPGPHGGKRWRKEKEGDREEPAEPGSYQEARQQWQQETGRLDQEHQEARAQWEQDVERIRGQYRAEHEAWQARQDARNERAQAIDSADPVGNANEAERTPAVAALEKAASAWQQAAEHRYDEGGREQYALAARTFAAAQTAAWQAAYGPESACRKELAGLGASEQDLARYDALVAREGKDQERAGGKLVKLAEGHVAFLEKLDDMEAKAPEEPDEPEEPEPPEEPAEDASQEERGDYQRDLEQYNRDHAAWAKALPAYDRDSARYDAYEEKLAAGREKEEDLAGQVDEAQQELETETWEDSAGQLRDLVEKVKERLTEQIGREDDRDPEPPEEPDDDDLPEEPQEPDYPEEPDPDDFDPEVEPAGAGQLASGEDVTFVPHQSAGGNDATLMVDPGKLDQDWARDEGYYIPPGGGGAEIAGRRARFERFLQEGEPVQAPRAVLGGNGRLAFEDGRHRFSVLRDLGIDRVALTVPKEQAEEFKKRYGAEG